MNQDHPRQVRPYAVHLAPRPDPAPGQARSTEARPPAVPAQLELFPNDNRSAERPTVVTLELLIDGRKTVIDGMERVLTFLEIVQRTNEEGR